MFLFCREAAIMLFRSSFLAVGLMFLLAAAGLAGEPLFDSKPGHSWDQARDMFYTRRFSTGEVFEDPHAFAPPWLQYYPFRRDAAFYEQVNARLKAVQKLPKSQMEEQPASRRLILLQDLWAVFDRLELTDSRWPVEDDKHAVVLAATARWNELLSQLASIMRRLELTEEEVAALPNAFQTVADKQLFPKVFNPTAAGQAFFPTDLLDKDGPWVAYASEQEPSAGGTAHMTFVHYRSIFTIHLRIPDGREAGEKFLQEFTQANRQKNVPPGTMLALLRRSIVPTRAGKLVVSPFVESLQLIVAAPPKDHRFKFTLDRKSFLTGELGLKVLGKDDPLDHTNFDSLIMDVPASTPRTDDNGETAIMSKFKTLNELPRSLASCVRCHFDTTSNNIFGRMSGPRLAYVQRDLKQAEAKVVKVKEATPEWKLYLRLRADKASSGILNED